MIKYLKKITLNNLSFLIPYIVVWIATFVFAMMQSKAETHMIINAYNASWADTFFKHFTQMGGAIPWVLAGLLLFYRYRLSLYIIATQTATALITYILKQIFSVPRPSILLSQLGYDFHTVEGVSLHSTLSFPSGHTASAFALMFAISVLCKRQWQKALCLIIAILVGFSRIYLSQHFVQDVLAGSIVGILAVTLTAYWFTEKHWTDANIITSIHNRH